MSNQFHFEGLIFRKCNRTAIITEITQPTWKAVKSSRPKNRCMRRKYASNQTQIVEHHLSGILYAISKPPRSVILSTKASVRPIVAEIVQTARPAPFYFVQHRLYLYCSQFRGKFPSWPQRRVGDRRRLFVGLGCLSGHQAPTACLPSCNGIEHTTASWNWVSRFENRKTPQSSPQKNIVGLGGLLSSSCGGLQPLAANGGTLRAQIFQKNFGKIFFENFFFGNIFLENIFREIFFRKNFFRKILTPHNF